jgi:hypothetical protein
MTKLHGKIASESKPGAESTSKRIIEIAAFAILLLVLGAIGAFFLGMWSG